MDTCFKTPGTILRRQNIRKNMDESEKYSRKLRSKLLRTGKWSQDTREEWSQKWETGYQVTNQHARTYTRTHSNWNMSAVRQCERCGRRMMGEVHVSHYWTLPLLHVDTIQGTNNENKAAGTSYPNALIPGGGHAKRNPYLWGVLTGRSTKDWPNKQDC
jgi:hypothetical protein